MRAVNLLSRFKATLIALTAFSAFSYSNAERLETSGSPAEFAELDNDGSFVTTTVTTVTTGAEFSQELAPYLNGRKAMVARFISRSFRRASDQGRALRQQSKNEEGTVGYGHPLSSAVNRA
jgi:hypothetical protein